MPMLAETKQKSRVGLNPRGTLWTKDENKFGQKLLEKMGWAKGKGLGKNEQGCQDAIKVSGNSENKGVGFKENSESWTQHYQGFEDALANLNSLNNDEAATGQNLGDGENVLENVESLEIKSKNSKSRVHYKKFTRGKDLSRYNEDDLACVLGSKRAPKKGESETPIEDLDKGQACAEEELEIGQMDKSHGLTTVYGGNLKDYFSQKMAELKRKREEGLLGDGIETRSGDQTPSQSKRSNNSDPSTPFLDLEFTPQRTEFSFNYSLQEPEPECNNDSSEVKVKKKKKSKEKDLEMEEVVNENETVKKKHKKDKKRKNEESDKENERRLVAEGSNESQKKEKKYCKRENELNENYSKNNETDENNSDTTGGIEEESKKNKKKNIETEYNTATSDFVSKKKKKKKKKEENITCDSNGNCEHQNEFENNDDVALFSGDMNESYLQANSKEKNKKKKRKEKEEEKDNEPLKPLKKLRRLASEISFSDILKSTNEKADKRVSLIDKDSVNDDELVEESEPKPKVKLTSKKSFRELTSELEDKIRKKVKKRNKNDMERIEEKEEEVSNDLEEKVKKREKKDYEKDMKSVEEKKEVNEIEEKPRKKERKQLIKLTEEATEGETNDEPKKKMKKRRKDMEPISEDEKKIITGDDSGVKIKKKEKKKSKKDLKFIEEEGTGECLADNRVSVKTNNEGEIESSDITVLVPEKENESSFHSKIKHYKPLKVDVKKLFPGSNLLSIIGYTKNDD